MIPEGEGFALADLRAVVAVALERGSCLLDAEELAFAEEILALSGPEGELFARLAARVTPAWEVGPRLPPDLAAALVAQGLLVDGATREDRLSTATRPWLVERCHELGRPTGGRVEDLRERLRDLAWEDPRRLVSPGHPGWLRRLERWAFLDKEPDRGVMVAERLGHVRRPPWPRTGGAPPHRDRASLLAWEALWERLKRQTCTPEAASEALRSGAADALGRLSLRRRCLERLLTGAEEASRAGDPDLARARLDLAVDVGADPVAVGRARARVEEAAGDTASALVALRRALPEARAEARLEVHRVGRRLARALRVGWAPDPPLLTPPSRAVKLEPAGQLRGRPAWKAGDRAVYVEEAVAARLRGVGRASVRGEGGLLTTVVVALLGEALWIPVEGAFPVPGLPGPLDLGRPGFAERRPAAIAAARAAVLAGEGPLLVRTFCSRLSGYSVLGWGTVPERAEGVEAAVQALGPRGSWLLVERFLADGWSAAAGFPDLLVLDGPEVVLEGCFPARVPAGGRLVEVKGPGDVVRDAQKIWFDALLRVGVAVEVAEVSPGPLAAG